MTIGIKAGLLWKAAVVSSLLGSATTASAAIYFADDFSAAPKGDVSGDFHVDRGVLVTSNPYPDNDSALYVPRFDASGATVAYLTFAIAYSTESFDRVQVYFNGTNVYSASGFAHSGRFNSEQPLIDVSNLIMDANQLEFDFFADGSVNGPGVRLDNIMVSDQSVRADPIQFDGFTPVPELSSWMMMVTGLFSAGAAMRSRKRTAPIAC